MKNQNESLRVLWLALFFSLFMLAGCQSLTFSVSDPELASRTPRECGESITLSGRVSLQYTLSQNGRSESVHGRFSWQQSGNAIRVGLYSPLGQTMARIEIHPDLAIFYAPGRTPVAARNPDELLLNQIGWPLPILGLRHWLLGCMQLDDGQFLQATPSSPELTTANGWSIRYERWMPFGENQLVPRRIDMSFTPLSPAPVTAIHIRLVADDWSTVNR